MIPARRCSARLRVGTAKLVECTDGANFLGFSVQSRMAQGRKLMRNGSNWSGPSIVVSHILAQVLKDENSGRATEIMAVAFKVLRSGPRANTRAC